MKKELGLYVHIPFCKSKCAYCNFNSYANKFSLMNDYLVCLLNEIKHYSKDYKNNYITTIYIGGGTPSTLISGAVNTIITTIKQNYNVTKNCEISIEANPNSITYDNALEWNRCGVNRVSVGLQTTKPNLLKLLNRTHTKQDYINAINTLKSVGFTNINTDLMICLPTQKQSQIKSAINLVNKLGCTHISTYSLILEEGTPLYEKVKNNQIKPLKESKSVSMYKYTIKYLRKCGFNQYEVSNFAKNGMCCKHNVNCWNMVPYLGFGAGAHSFNGKQRYSNVCGIEDYISKINKVNVAVETSEICTNKSLFEEYVMLGLRKTNGINLSYILKNYNIDLLNTKNKEINFYIKNNYLILENNKLYATIDGFLILNKIILDLVC